MCPSIRSLLLYQRIIITVVHYHVPHHVIRHGLDHRVHARRELAGGRRQDVLLHPGQHLDHDHQEDYDDHGDDGCDDDLNV